LIVQWPCPGGDEFAVVIDRGRRFRLLIVPPLFAEMNRTRRWLNGTMRALDLRGIDSVMPDLPGTNESQQPFAAQSLHAWRTAMARAARHFDSTHVLALRGGALVFPNVLPGWVVDPVSGSTLLRQVLRARLIAAREAGRHEDSANLLELARSDGIELAGYDCSPALIAGLDSARPLDEGQREIRLGELGGAPLWLRAEPGDDPAQAERLATLIAAEIAA
jgi:hypothetical protein